MDGNVTGASEGQSRAMLLRDAVLGQNPTKRSVFLARCGCALLGSSPFTSPLLIAAVFLESYLWIATKLPPAFP